MDDFLPSGDINIRHITSRKSELPPFEKKVADIARCNQKDVLEANDFFVDAKCLPITIQKPEVKKTQLEKFESYRKQLIASLVNERLKPIIEIHPKFDTKLLTDFLATNARAVTNISNMLDKLAKTLIPRKEFNEVGLIMLSFIWIMLYNLRELHKAWLKEGNPPILPGKETEKFIKLAMKKLEKGDLKIGALPANAPLSVAAYSPEEKMLKLSPDLIKNPRDILNYDTAINPSVLLHELYHFYQCATKKKLTRVRFEVEAHIFDSKISILTLGYKRAREITASQDNNGQKRLKKELQSWMLRKSKGALDAAAANLYNALSKRLNFLKKVEFIDLAHVELEKNTIDDTGRKKLEVAYMEDYLYHLIDLAMFQLYKQYVLNKDAIQTKFNKLKSPLVLTPFKTDSTLNGDDQRDAFIMYLWKATEQYVLIYCVKGETAANKFLNEQYFPILLGKSASAYLMNMAMFPE